MSDRGPIIDRMSGSLESSEAVGVLARLQAVREEIKALPWTVLSDDDVLAVLRELEAEARRSAVTDSEKPPACDIPQAVGQQPYSGGHGGVRRSPAAGMSPDVRVATHSHPRSASASRAPSPLREYIRP
jgi:hypothetical protein